MTPKYKCSSCGCNEFEENFTLDVDYDFDACDKCYKENEGK
jgi:hypothetical protein